MKALVFNCGSSSLKFELLELDASMRNRKTLARGKVEEIGAHATAHFVGPDGKETRGSAPAETHKHAALHAIGWMESISSQPLDGLDIVAHRVVHGGGEVEEPRLVDAAVYSALERAAQFAPLHNPIAISVMRAVQERLPKVPAAVVTDTAFHRDMPPEAYTYALPYDLAQRYGLRRYGFHGIGHAWMMERYAEITGKNPPDLNLVTFHLGAGCSGCAIRGGKSVDTSMGMTPLEGLVMATRSGDLDPAIVTWLGANAKLANAEIERILNNDSGMKGVSGLSDDLRELEQAAGKGNQRAALAIEVFCHRARKYLGAYLAIPPMSEAVIFSGGIGEHSVLVRERICADLEWIGLEIDRARNRDAHGEARISSDKSRIAIHVIAMDEELYIARSALRLL
ncbi:MAG TPA: acetate/propionate family kinase [Candidatus Binataceae bacterium]|nr:acetate/propionate family kinase [Candidatus Binataceae bacterium]